MLSQTPTNYQRLHVDNDDPDQRIHFFDDPDSDTIYYKKIPDFDITMRRFQLQWYEDYASEERRQQSKLLSLFILYITYIETF
jgi:hypothetical protein